MWRRQSPLPTLLALLFLALCPIRPAGAVGPPIQLEDVKSFLFTFTPLRVADLDGVSGADLSGIQGDGVVFAPNDGHGGFGSLQSIPMGTGPLSLYEARDLDGDGRPDLIAYSPSAGVIAIRLNVGGGNYTPPALTPVPGSPAPSTPVPSPPLALGDLDGDGRPDVVMVLDSAYVAVMMNDGSGHLLPATRFVADGAYTAPQVADFNGDGKADLLFRNWSTPGWYFLAGHRDGTFDPPVVTPTNGFSPFIAPSVADLDGDGDLDLVTSNESRIFIFPNRGDGTFDAEVAVTSFDANYLSDVKVGDLDHDGRPDIVAMDGTGMTNTMGGTSNLRVSLNRGNLSFGPTTNYPVLQGGLMLADLDGDGWLDALVTGGGVDRSCLPGWRWPTGSTFIFYNRMGALEGLFEFADPVWLPARGGTGALPDLFGSRNGLMLRARNRGNGTFDSAAPIGWGDPRLARDIDGDGDDDLLVASGDSTWVLSNLGAAGFGPPSFTMVGFTYRDFADFNGDGRLDLLATAPDSELVMFPGDGACGFGTAVHYGHKVPAAAGDDVVRGADLNGDGFADVLCGHMDAEGWGSGVYDVSALLLAFLNDRNGGFSPPESSVSSFSAGPNSPHHQGFLRLGDWNGDGARDAILVAAACTEDNRPPQCAFVGTGDGTFVGVPLPSTFSNSPCDVQVADLNGDRLDDLVRINDSSGCTFHAAVFTADGTGGFAERWYPMGYEPIAARLADLDGDGRLDLVTRNVKAPAWTVFSYSIRRNVTPIDTPTPTLVSLVSARVEGGVVHLDWFASSPYSASIERRSSVTGWSAIGRGSSDGTGHLRYDDRDVTAGESYGYRLRVSEADGEHLSGESWVSVAGIALSLRGSWPNPTGGIPTFSASLPGRGPAEILVYDIAGRVVHRERLEGLAAGAHRITLNGSRLEPGMYVARLVFAGRRVQTSFIVLR